MRFDGHRYAGCRWRGGRGCLQCEGEFNEAYAAAFPEGLKPVATFKLDNPDDVARAHQLLSPDSLRAIFGSGGGGMQELMRRIKDTQPNLPAEAKERP